MRIRFVCPHCKVARTWASSRVLAGHYLASQKQVAMAISVHELLQVCRYRLGSFGFIFADILLLTLSFHHETE